MCSWEPILPLNLILEKLSTLALQWRSYILTAIIWWPKEYQFLASTVQKAERPCDFNTRPAETRMPLRRISVGEFEDRIFISDGYQVCNEETSEWHSMPGTLTPIPHASIHNARNSSFAYTISTLIHHNDDVLTPLLNEHFQTYLNDIM